MSDDTIKLIVEVPKDYYEIIKHDVEHHLTDYRPFEIIANGTPLPKGHGRLIDADALNRKDVNCANVPMNFIDTAPPIIEADEAESEEK